MFWNLFNIGKYFNFAYIIGCELSLLLFELNNSWKPWIVTYLHIYLSVHNECHVVIKKSTIEFVKGVQIEKKREPPAIYNGKANLQ